MAAKRPGGNAPQIEGLHGLLVKLCGGKDLTVLPAHTDYSLLQLLGEVGTDLSPWPTEKHFTAWLGLAPGSHQSSNRKGSVGRKRNRAGRLFCVMGRSLARSKQQVLETKRRALQRLAKQLGQVVLPNWDQLQSAPS